MGVDLSVRSASAAPQRATDALLRCLGGRTVLLRLPTNAVSGSDADQLGAGSPSYEDLPLSPAVFRRLRPKLRDSNANQYELLISAASVHAQLGLMELASTDQLFAMATGIFVDGELMLIVAAAEAEAFGCPYLYRLILAAPRNQTL
ncbi:MAG TPA: hypothetical protein VE195_09095 [Acidobacteriaceae bacterium]|jgi:hypothetical protein|nr:hypothetical protein [Acidobacteriaceae bacterium]